MAERLDAMERRVRALPDLPALLDVGASVNRAGWYGGAEFGYRVSERATFYAGAGVGGEWGMDVRPEARVGLRWRF